MICPDDDSLYGRAFELLESGDRAVLDSHLVGCARCRTRQEELRRRLACLDSVREVRPMRDLAAEVWNRLEATARLRRRLYLAAFLVLAVGAGILIHFLHAMAVHRVEQRFLRDVEHAVQIYRNERGEYPPSGGPLGRYVELPAERVDSKGRVLDRWGRPYVYTFPGEHNPRLFDIQSLGPDGVDEDGRGDDLKNW